MKRIASLFLVLFLAFAFNASELRAQDCDILYFCVKYEGGEKDCSDRFTTGKITVMVKLNGPVYYTKVSIQSDKYNPKLGKFEYHDKKEFDVSSDMTYIYFPNIEFGDPGFYRVFLLDPQGNTMTSGLVEIIKR